MIPQPLPPRVACWRRGATRALLAWSMMAWSMMAWSMMAWSMIAATTAYGALVPLFPAASDEVRQGFVRVINHSARAGTVAIVAIDDAGDGRHELTLGLGPNEAAHFNSEDLEVGNADKGLTGATGAGEGDWRLELTSELDIDVLAYIRTKDAFLTSMHDLVPVGADGHRVVTFNPGDNRKQVSQLRLINAGSESATVTIEGIDDRGEPGNRIEVSVPSGAATTLTAEQLESGDPGMGDGSGDAGIGNGSGKWRLAVTADQPIHVMSLLASPTGHLTNLSSVPATRGAATLTVPLLPAAGDASNQQGFVRVINHADLAAEVHITAFDDTGVEHGPLTLAIEAKQTVHFNSDDLESGAPNKGLSGDIGDGEGDWRLDFNSEAEIEVLAYVRVTERADGTNADVAGFLTAMHDVAPSSTNTHRVPFFNPATNTKQVSRLRLVNQGAEPASVTISGIDDRGESPGSAVQITVPARGTHTLSAAQLEPDANDRQGALKDGQGKWRLVVESDRPITVLNLMESADGLLTNLSTTPSGTVGLSAAVFRTSISEAIVQSKCIGCHVRGGQSGRTRLVFLPSSAANHEASNLAAFKDLLVDVDGGVELILDKIQGNRDHGGGAQVVAGSDDYADMERFLHLLDEEAAMATNKRPRIELIEDQVLEIGDSIDVAVTVTDGDSMDTHAIAASTPDTCVTELFVRGETLSLTALQAGSVTVTVTATDDSGEDNAASADHAFAVEIHHPEPPSWALPRAAPADLGADTCAVADVLDYVFTDEALQAALLVVDGRVVGERYAQGYGVENLVTSWSVAKSFYSAAVGVAIDEGYIESLDQKASVFFTEWIDTAKEDITIRNMLEMRAGFADPNVFVQTDQTQFSLDQGLVNQPGSVFLYSNSNSQLFEPLLRRATGLNAHEWLTERILKPIGIDETGIGLWLDPSGTNPLTYCCIDMRADDFARLGVLFANGGTWNGETVISEDYVDTSLDARVGWYGLQWWVLNTIYYEGYEPRIQHVSAAHGLDGQHIFVWPDGNVVLAVFTKYIHSANQGYVLSLDNFPNTCTGRNTCPGSVGSRVPTYNEYNLLDRMAELR